MLDRRAFTAAMGAGALALSACARQNEPLRVWAMGVEGEALGRFAQAYQAENPGKLVRVQALPWGAAHEKLLTAFAADDLPDVIALGNTWIAEFAALDALTPLDALLSQSTLNRDGSFDAAVRATTINGRAVAVPWYVDTRLLFYRPDLLKRAGFSHPATNWAEWDQQLKAVARLKSGGHSLLMPINEYEPLVAFCLQSGAPLLRDNATHGNFRDPAIKAAFARVADLYWKGYAQVLTSTEVPDLYSGFARGDYGFVVSGPWNLGEFAKRMPTNVEWATAVLPGPEAPGASLSGGVSLCIPRRSKNADAAFAFIEYLCAPAQQAALHAAAGDLPADRAAWTLAGLDRDDRAQAFFHQLQLAVSPPQAPEWERIANEMAAALERVVRHIQPLDAALKGLDEFAELTLAKRRSMQKGAA